ncbi:[LysW]-aminoadipate kinase [Micromonospora sp. NPDC050980]|uniref:[LysW]-aminoadipate kinase n=1 Tax=Micromonospora sp. NPDC050980 TaxID=3155161 RepID=UPI0033E6B7FA
MTARRPLVVVKSGGNAGVDPAGVCADVAVLTATHRVVLVHGGSAATEALAARLGVPQRFHTSASGVRFRHTDAATLDVLTMAMVGRVKPTLVTELDRHGVPAVGLTGLDGGLLRAALKRDQVAVVAGRRMLLRGGRGGRITEVRADLLHRLLAGGYLPVVSPPALGADGAPVNVNADRVAGALATALRATALVLLTGAAGVLARPEATEPLPEVRLPRGEGAVTLPGVRLAGGMGLKLIAAREALRGGVDTVLVADGGVDRPVRRALDGAGTRIRLAHPEVPA